jgi:NTP pyrophosphatase (non-canonical NTP hydrolase)
MRNAEAVDGHPGALDSGPNQEDPMPTADSKATAERDAIEEARQRMARAFGRYGPFASTHEALGVLAEEWDELRIAVRANASESVRDEALDLAAVALRLAAQCRSPGEQFDARSGW